MDNRCPNCQYDLSKILLSTKPVDCGSRLSKVPVPYPRCQTLLEPNVNKQERVAALVFAGGLLAYIVVVPRLDPQLAMYVGPALIVLGLLAILWFFKFHQRNLKRWKEFDLAKFREIFSKRRRLW